MDTKADLKAAREAIAAKRFDEAIKTCKRVLMWEGSNYNAWVFLGAAHAGNNEEAEAEEAYRRAMEINNDNLLAWHGLISLFEKNSRFANVATTIQSILPIIINSGDGQRVADYLNKLIDIYEKKEKDDTKYIDTLSEFLPTGQYYKLIKSAKNIPTPVEVYQRIAALTEVNEKKTIENLVQSRRNLLNAGSLEEIRAKAEGEVYNKSRLGEYYRAILKESPSTDIEIKLLHYNYKKLPSLLDKEKLYQKVIELANHLVEERVDDLLPYELVIEAQNVTGPDQYNASLIDTVATTFPESGLAKFHEAYCVYRQGDMETSFSLFSEGIELSPSNLYGYQCISWVYHDAKEFSAGLEYATRGRDLVLKYRKDMGRLLNRVHLFMELMMAHCYRQMDTKYYPDATALYEKVLAVDPSEKSALEGMGLILCEEKRYEDALLYFEKVRELDPTRHMAVAEIGWIHYAAGHYEKAIEAITQAIELAGEPTAEYNYRLGVIYWTMGETHSQSAFGHLIQAAKLDPHLAGAFAYLGHYYRTIHHDHTRAYKCYQKAFALDPSNAEAGLPLSNYYLQEGNNALAETVIRQVSQLAPKTGWAWRRLAFASMNAEDYAEATTLFQKALRCDTNDVACWVGLAEAYAREGRFVAALKAYGRSTDLDPSSVPAHTGKAMVKSQVGMFNEAIQDFRTLLDEIPTNDQHNYVPAIYGLADTYLARAKDDIQLGFFGRAASDICHVVRTLWQGLQIDKKIIGLWKLLGDACALYRLIPSSADISAYAELQSAMKLVHDLNTIPFPTFALVSTLIDDFLGLAVSEDFQLPASDALDVSLCCATYAYKQAIVLSRNHSSVAPALWYDLALVNYWFSRRHANLESTAIQCIKVALKMESHHYTYWNALGVMAMSTSPKLSQYAFVKAIEYNNRSAVPWTNYGFFCLERKDYELASQAFDMAHSIDPECIPAWVGHAFISSAWGSDAAGLFEHAFEASNGSAAEASYGYAESVWNKAKSTTLSQTDLIAPTIGMLKLTEHKVDDPLALNLYGLLLERLGQPARAAEVFAKAILILEQREQNERQAFVHANLGRVLCASGDFEGSISSFHTALETLPTPSTSRIYCLAGAGIAYYFSDKLEDSLLMFETALNETNGAGVRQDVIVLLAKVLWALGGEEQRSVAKDQLFSSITEDSIHLSSIFTLCAIGMLEDDSTLINASLDELAKVPMDIALTQDEDQHIPWLRYQCARLQEDTLAAECILKKQVHLQPWNPMAWSRLAASGVATSSALTVIQRSRSVTADTKAAAYEHAAASPLDAQRAIMLAPWRLSAWQTLATQSAR